MKINPDTDKHFNIIECESLGIGAADYIRSVISEPRLQNILAGNNLMYAGNENTTPLLIHSLITNSFIESAWRVLDGSHNLINALVDSVKATGGKLLTNSNAVRFIPQNNLINSIELSSGERIEGKYFISNTHPAQVLSMARDMKMTGAYSYRINNLEDTPGIFTVYLVFKKKTFPYFNYNFHHYNQENVWAAGSYDLSKWPNTYVFMPNATSASTDYADGASVLTYMNMGELSEWRNTVTGNRGEAYDEFKKMRSMRLLDSVDKQFPGIKSCVEAYYSSTPLTWRDYTGTREGSAFGLVKDFHKPMESVVLPRTKIPNLFLTGQNTNLHGVLGVTISSVNACGQILGTDYLINKIRNA
jgi:all-trans-retinol 13,14-reductase